MVPYISFSSWSTWKKCEYRWKNDYLDNLKSKPVGIYLDFGTSVHRTLQRLLVKSTKKPINYKEKHLFRVFQFLFLRHVDFYEPLEKFRIVFEFRKKMGDLYFFENLHNFIKKSDKKSATKEFLKLSLEDKNRFLSIYPDLFVLKFNQLVEAGVRIINDVLSSELNNCVVFNEFPLYEKISRTDGNEIYLKGFIDLVVKGKDFRNKTILLIYDFKTCSWGWDREKKNDQEILQQLFLYKYFLCKKFELNLDSVKTKFALFKRTPSKKETTSIEILNIPSNKQTIQKALDGFQIDITKMFLKEKTSNFIKNREACIDKFGGICPYLNTIHCTND